MPCRSDYLEQTGIEAGLQRAAKLCVYVSQRSCAILPHEINEQADEYYAKDVGQVQWLCNALRTMGPAEKERIIYDAHDARARDLANWWEEHQAADAEREAREAEDIRREALVISAMGKLTPEETEALRHSLKSDLDSQK